MGLAVIPGYASQGRQSSWGTLEGQRSTSAECSVFGLSGIETICQPSFPSAYPQRVLGRSQAHGAAIGVGEFV